MKNDDTYDISWGKLVNYTTAYDKDYKYIGMDTASDRNITRTLTDYDSTQVGTYTFHSVGNPYANPLATIDYEVDINYYRNGSVTGLVSHDRAPSHEMFFRIDDRNIVKLFYHENEGFEWLAIPHIGNKYIINIST
jgi:hypothetical protein